MEGRHYEVRLTDGRTMEVILVKSDKGFIGVAEDGFFIGIYANDFEKAKNLFVDAYEEYNTIQVVWD